MSRVVDASWPDVEHRPAVAADADHSTCETYAGWEPDEQCGRAAWTTVWVQCHDDGPRERGICRDHLAMLADGVAFRCRYCAADLNLLHVGAGAARG